MMKRVWPWWLRTMVSVSVVLLFYWPYAAWSWHSRMISGPGLLTMSPTGEIVRRMSVMALLVDHFTLIAVKTPKWLLWIWDFTYASATTAPASVIGVLVFAWLTRRFGPPSKVDPYCRCRRCRYILNGLSEPRCPECAEPI